MQTMVVFTSEILLLGLLICGAIQDILRFKLPNWLTLATAVVAVVWVALTTPSFGNILLHAVAGVAMLATGMLAYRFNMLGGGDVKWLAGLALWIGLSVDLVRFLMLTSFIGGLLAIFILLLSRLKPAYGLRDGKRHLPYGVAIAAAGLDFWFRRGQLSQDLMILANS
nr:prepilin peptidase [uncultured Dongia sp.]